MPGWFGSSRAELAAEILAWDEASLTPLSLMGCITPQQSHQNTMEGGSGSKCSALSQGDASYLLLQDTGWPWGRAGTEGCWFWGTPSGITVPTSPEQSIQGGKQPQISEPRMNLQAHGLPVGSVAVLLCSQGSARVFSPGTEAW